MYPVLATLEEGDGKEMHRALLKRKKGSDWARFNKKIETTNLTNSHLFLMNNASRFSRSVSKNSRV